MQRLRQGVSSLRPRLPPDRDAILAEILTSHQAEAFRELPVHDQAHLCRVYQGLRGRGVEDRDLLVAALLHDIGKVSASGNARVGLVDRVAGVILRRMAPRLLDRLSRQSGKPWRLGLVLAVHHAPLGAHRAATLGCSARSCWLIAHHADRPLPSDNALHLLAAADDACS